MKTSDKRVFTNGQLTLITHEDYEALCEQREVLLKLGRATNRADRDRANKLIDEVYAERGLAPPKEKVWVDSPKAALDFINQAKGTNKKWYSPCFGAHDLYWLGHWDFIKSQFDLKAAVNTKPHMDLIEAAGGWYWPFTNAVVFSERPSTLKLDNEGRLHCENGPAMGWDDGFGVYAWHGTRVPKEWILHPEKQKPKDALTWNNIEQRRCLAEIIGWDKILSELDCKVIDEAEPEIGVLLQADLPDSPKERFLKVRCGTGRYFVLPVPPDMKTALEANAWTYGLTADDLMNLEVRT